MQVYHFQIKTSNGEGYSIQSANPQVAKAKIERKLDSLFPNFGDTLTSYLWDIALAEGSIERELLGYTLRLEATYT